MCVQLRQADFDFHHEPKTRAGEAEHARTSAQSAACPSKLSRYTQRAEPSAYALVSITPRTI